MTKNDQASWDMLYKQSGGTCASPFRIHLHRKIYEIIPDDVETILDAGCGGGGLSAFLARKEKYILEGVDISPEGVRNAIENFDIKAQVGNLTDLHQFSDNSFDTVVCSEVTEHIPLPALKKVITELFRVARKYVIMTNPFQERLSYYHYQCAHCLTRFHPAGHIHSIGESFVKDLVTPYAESVSFIYSGQRDWYSPLYASALRMFGYSLLGNHVNTCPLCNIAVSYKKPGMPVRLSGYVYRLTQLALKRVGITHAANIISVVKVKE